MARSRAEQVGGWKDVARVASVAPRVERGWTLVLSGLDLLRYSTEEIVELGADLLDGELVPDRRSRPAGEINLRPRVLPDLAEKRRPGVIVAPLDDVSVLPRGDDLGDATWAFRGYRDATPRHRLDQGEGEALEIREQYEEVVCGTRPHDFVPAHPTWEGDPAVRDVGSSQALELLAGVVVGRKSADQGDLVGSSSAIKGLCQIDEIQAALLVLDQPAGVDESHLVRFASAPTGHVLLPDTRVVDHVRALADNRIQRGDAVVKDLGDTDDGIAVAPQPIYLLVIVAVVGLDPGGDPDAFGQSRGGAGRDQVA